MPITHSKVSSIPDGSNTSLVRPSDWNAAHVVSGLTTAEFASANVSQWTNDAGYTTAQNLFKTIAVSGQSDVVADSPTDTLTIAAGSNITITTNATTDTITIAASGGGSSAFADLTSGTNTTAAMVVGTGASLDVSGSGTIVSTSCTGNAATATILATARAIYGNNFDGSAALTQIIASTYGGTGNGFTKFTGAATSEKTYTLPNANATIKFAGKETIWIPAAAIRPSATGGCATLATIATSANQPDIQSLDFDTTTQEYAQFAIAFPKSWNEGTITAQFYWSHASTSTNFGVVWNLQGVAQSDDDAIAAAYGTAQQVADTGGTTNDQYVTAETSAITIAGTPAAEDICNFRVSRVTGDASDTMAIDARLMGIKLYFTTDAGDDS